MAGVSRKVLVVAFAMGWVLTARAYAETVQFIDTQDPTGHASLQFDQVNEGMGSYAWDRKPAQDSTKLTVPPLVEGKRDAVEKHFLGLSWLTMVEMPGDPDVKMEHSFGSIGPISSSFAVLRGRRQEKAAAPDGYQTGMNEKKSGGTFAAIRLKF